MLLPFGEVAVVAGLSSFGSLLAFATVNLALIILRYREPERERPFRVPVALGGLPLFPALGALATLPLLTQFEPVVYVTGGGAILLGSGLYAARRFWSSQDEQPKSLAKQGE
jgi:APA family basic amino acid/polyamine antiporter